eukprot:gene17920-biopygen3291
MLRVGAPRRSCAAARLRSSDAELRRGAPQKHVNSVGALPVGQHAYRPRHGTNTAVMHLIDGITKILENDQDCVVDAMDLSAAFDTVDHAILLEKLRKRGSVLGPIRFSLNVSDVVENFPGITIVQYADDCTMLIPVQPGEEVGPVVRRQVQRFVDYCAANRIAAEPEKTQLMHVRCKPQPRNTFEALQAKLPGRWYARSADFEVPSITVDSKLMAVFDDGTRHQITKGAKHECHMEVEGVTWTAETVYKRQIFWRDGESTVKWTKLCVQPQLTEASESESDSEPPQESRPS